MIEQLDIVRMAQALAAHSGERLSLIAENVANVDTPGYRARDLPDFAATYEGDALPLRETRAGHVRGGATQPMTVLAEGSASPDGNTVSLEAEMVRAASVRQDHAMALAIYRSSTEILRSALGRRG